MYKHDYSKHLAGVAALCAFAALGGQAAQAQLVTKVTSFGQLTSPIKTDQYPTGPLSGASRNIVPQTFSVADGTGPTANNLTFTATNGVPASGFLSNLADATIGPQFSDPTFGGAFHDVILNTSFVGPTQNVPTAPVLIQFQNPVSGFGLLAQDFLSDQETFTLNIFADTNATVSLGTFVYGPVDNSGSAGTAVFVGALSATGLPVIRSATLSSVSSLQGENNDLFFGPAQVNAPVPEASTVVGFGMGVVLFGGLMLAARRRKVGAAS